MVPNYGNEVHPSSRLLEWSGANRQPNRKPVVGIVVVANDRLVKHKSFPPLGRMATRHTLPESNSRFPRQIKVGAQLQTTEPYGKPQLPVPMTCTFRGISWYR